MKTAKTPQTVQVNNEDDSFLAAARMLRGGGRHKTWEMSSPVNRNAPSSNKTAPKPAQTEPKEEQPQAVCESKTTGSIKEAVHVKENGQANENALSISGNTTANVQRVAVRIWRSGCRPNLRNCRRFKAPLLPPIAEV